jgi:hypothetical protein
VSAWSPKSIARGLVLGAIALGVGAGLGRLVGGEGLARDVRRPGAPAAPDSAERALVAPLKPGDALADFRVDFISSVVGGAFVVECARGLESIRVIVALDGGPARAPATAAGYAIYYLADHASGARDPDGARLAQALAALIERNPGAARPAGLQTFTPDSQ